MSTKNYPCTHFCTLVTWLAVGLVAQSEGYLVSPDIARFAPAGVDIDPVPARIVFDSPFDSVAEIPGGWNPVPEFITSGDTNLVRISIESGTSLYGTGEVAGPLLRNDKTVELWNTDSYRYSAANQQLYQSHPWVLAVRADGTSYGVLAMTTYRCRVSLQNSIVFSTTGPSYEVCILRGSTPQEVITKLASLIGTIEMPPLWALGFHQCRYSYYPDSRVREIADNFRDRSIPCDVIWMDINYMDGFRVFTFDPSGFPDPGGLNDYLHSKQFKAIWMIDPGVKAEAGYFVYDQGTAQSHWTQTLDGVPFTGNVWPGECVFPDYTRPQTQTWWSGLYQDFMAQGIDGVWNDMNEPAVFGSPTGTMPETNIHRGGGDLPQGTHDQYHNVYGMLMVKATREGILAANPNKRPFVLSRANFIGGQRFAATWTGDNTASWDHLRMANSMVLNLGMSGQPFSGPDIGGYSEDGTAELYARWIGVGAFYPFSRGHTESNTRNKEPWAWDASTESIARVSLQRRYCLMPYLYTVFQEAATSGLPVMRPVFFADLTNQALRNESDAFLLGSDLLIVPNLSENGVSNPQEPGGIWRAFSVAGEDAAGNVAYPTLKIRGGAIIPTGVRIENTTQNMLDTLTLIVALNAPGHAEGSLYEDAGDGFGYQNGDFILTRFEATQSNGSVTISIASSTGSLPRPARVTRVKLLTDSGIEEAYGNETTGIVVSSASTMLVSQMKQIQTRSSSNPMHFTIRGQRVTTTQSGARMEITRGVIVEVDEEARRMRIYVK